MTLFCRRAVATTTAATATGGIASTATNVMQVVLRRSSATGRAHDDVANGAKHQHEHQGEGQHEVARIAEEQRAVAVRERPGDDADEAWPGASGDMGHEGEEVEAAHLLATAAVAGASSSAGATTGVTVDISVLQQAQLEAMLEESASHRAAAEQARAVVVTWWSRGGHVVVA